MHNDYKTIGPLKLIAATATQYSSSTGGKVWKVDASGSNLKQVPYKSKAAAVEAIKTAAASGNTAKGSALTGTAWAAFGGYWGHGYANLVNDGSVQCSAGQVGITALAGCTSVTWKVIKLGAYSGITKLIGTQVSKLKEYFVGSGAAGGKTGWFNPVSTVCTTDPRTATVKVTCNESSEFCFSSAAIKPSSSLAAGTACTPFAVS